MSLIALFKEVGINIDNGTNGIIPNFSVTPDTQTADVISNTIKLNTEPSK